MRVVAMVVCAVALGLPGLGCGDDDADTTGTELGAAAQGDTSAGDAESGQDGSDTGSESDLSEDEFVSQATQICKEASKRFQAEFQALTKKGNQQAQNAQKALAEGVAKAFNTELDEIGAISASAEDEGQVEAFLAALQKAATEIEDRPKALPQVGRQVEEAQRQAEGLGLEGCPLG